MKIDGKKLSQIILATLKKDVAVLRRKHKLAAPKLVIFSVNPSSATQSFMLNKKKAAQKIGAGFELIQYNKSLRFEEFANRVTSVAQDKNVSAIIIQYPLPASLDTVTLFDFISLEKEIEGFKKKSLFDEPIGLAVLTVLKQIYSPTSQQSTKNVFVDLKKDSAFFKQVFKRKKVVLLGRGKTGGRPIGEILSKVKINYININSETSATESFLNQADIIIAAVGKNVIPHDSIKDGVVLISVGMHKENGLWKGDFDEDKIKNKALAYTPTPGGIGPLNVAYLMSNLVKAWKLQHDLLEK
ncbi:hypothetical protein A3F34_02195 [Candidatus Roizmanbacteria bacterium RIFCSPHIGHO2_12_FULL_44_10]|uniref:Methenyltetrahydrofolate cyclohydrolase n=1 Tax=Candidatus Roizmanbacteria bacterium RIFCSPHIGHO2_12_FULL_44_10 TaxID=1802054 RepID=A0A1F7I6K0_9BACT|nr:MAG: hypothetical protein A3F34_02195 [Candidatus Roizmanbacteria bacterium RIFCSPHIGHO2_12_FULL_44_10]